MSAQVESTPKRRSKRIGNLPGWAQKLIEKSEEPDQDAEAMQIARRIVADYGGTLALKKLISMFEEGRSVSEIGEVFEVTKQRVSQWRQALGAVQETFTSRQIVQSALKKGIDVE